MPRSNRARSSRCSAIPAAGSPPCSIAAGLQRATWRGVIIDGTEVTGPGAGTLDGVSVACLLPWLTARENAAVAAARRAPRNRRRTSAATADHYLALVGVADIAGQRPAELSPGTQQCVSLARALAVEPRFSYWTSHSPCSTPSRASSCRTRYFACGRNPRPLSCWSRTMSMRLSTWQIGSS